MDNNEQSPVSEWNQALPIRSIGARKIQHAGGTLSPRSERVAEEADAASHRLLAADETISQSPSSKNPEVA